MKIAHVCPYDFSYPGGVVSHIVALTRYLVRMGHQVRIIAPASKGVSPMSDLLIPIGKSLPVPVSDSIARINLSLGLAPRIRELLAREKFDIVHLHEPFMPMLCTSMLRYSNTVNVGTFHAAEGKPGYRFAWPVSRVVLQLWARKLDGKIACCQAALEYAAKYIPGPYEIIPDGIDLEYFSPSVPPIDEFLDGKLNLLFVGRREKRKGLAYLIGAYQQVKRRLPSVRLIVVGPGQKYRKDVSVSGLQDVVFVGQIPNEMLPRYYRTADVFCSPATGRESFGIVLLEAMALGKPVIASRIPGHASWITHGRQGLLVQPKDTTALAKALMLLLTNDSLRRRMGGAASLTAKEYSLEQVVQRISSYYHKFLLKRR